jgi:hypothetical protein
MGRDENTPPNPAQDPALFAAFHAAVASYQEMFPFADN